MGAIKKTSPKATDNNRYAGSFVKRNRRRIIVGREDKSTLNTIPEKFNRTEQGEFMLGYFYQDKEPYSKDKNEEKEEE